MEIVAELSCNHSGSLQRAKDLIAVASDAGADAVKLQCWDRDSMVVDQARTIASGPWAGRNMADLYLEAWTPWPWFPPLFEYAAKLGIGMFSSVFDTKALAFLESINCPRYKIASFEALDFGFIDEVSDTGKPVILSAGLMTMADVIAVAMGWPEAWQLLCVSEYPAHPSAYNLGRIASLKRTWHVHVGVSDHTLGSAVPIAAAALGADMLEKHLQLTGDDTLDSMFSLPPKEFAGMVRDCRDTESALGTDYPEPSETALSFRRSLWVVKTLPAGEAITSEHIISARPAGGLPPDSLAGLIGHRVARDLAPGAPLREEDIAN